MPHITSANVACGFHAGDPVTMARTVELAKQFKIEIGAHPSYPDLMGFGRREMKLTTKELGNCIIYQIGALQAFARASNLSLQHVKPHGALYEAATKDENVSKTIVEAVQSVNPQFIIFASPKSAMAEVATKMGQRVALEAFADRAYNPDGTLVSRGQRNAVVENPQQVVERVRRMVREGTVLAINKQVVHLGEIHTICVHGDTPTAVELVKSLKAKLIQSKIDVKAVGAFL